MSILHSPIQAHRLPSTLRIKEDWFVDEHERCVLLRGVNVCGTSKIPNNTAAYWMNSPKFWDHRNISFIGRPFKEADVHEHLERISSWGLTFLRVLVPWEALEHAGPGQYDEAYIDYLIRIIELLPQYGMKCFIDPHQDTWSRLSGGSGSPGWTFEVAGMNPLNFIETGAAVLHDDNDALPMVWPTNYIKLACSTMFTLFFGGKTFAPQATVDGESIQDYLQRHYIACYQHLASRLKGLEHIVVGFESMNEPHHGYIGKKDISAWDPNKELLFACTPTALQSFALGDGHKQEVDYYVRDWPIPTKKESTRKINSTKLRAWAEGRECVWKQHGVWTMDDHVPVLLKPDYFSKDPATGELVEFERDFYAPFINAFSQAIAQELPHAFLFVEPVPNDPPPVLQDTRKHMVYAPHWYDLDCIFSKKFNGIYTADVPELSKGKNVLFNLYFGRQGAKKNYSKQIKRILDAGRTNIGKVPCFIGECGIPMDLNNKQAFTSGDFWFHRSFLDAVIYAMESNLVSFTLWNYNPINNNQHGDYWNGEDFSIFSPATLSRKSADVVRAVQRQSLEDVEDYEITASAAPAPVHETPLTPSCSRSTDTVETLVDKVTKFATQLDKGGRVLDALMRPYAVKVAGIPLETHFDLDNLNFHVKFSSNGHNASPTHRLTEIFVPNFHYKERTLNIKVSDGEYHYNADNQTLLYLRPESKQGHLHTIAFGVGRSACSIQ